MAGYKKSLTSAAMARQVRRAMDRGSITQFELAERSGLTDGMVNRILNQRDTVGTLPTWDLIARALGGRWVVELRFDETSTETD